MPFSTCNTLGLLGVPVIVRRAQSVRGSHHSQAPEHGRDGPTPTHHSQCTSTLVSSSLPYRFGFLPRPCPRLPRGTQACRASSAAQHPPVGCLYTPCLNNHANQSEEDPLKAFPLVPSLKTAQRLQRLPPFWRNHTMRGLGHDRRGEGRRTSHIGGRKASQNACRTNPSASLAQLHCPPLPLLPFLLLSPLPPPSLTISLFQD